MSAVDTKFYENKKNTSLYLSLIFLFLVVLVTIGVFFYNRDIESKITFGQDEISQLEQSILEIDTDIKVQAYRLYDRNLSLLQKKECDSLLTTFIIHLKRSLGKYALSFKGFNYSDGKILTNISAGGDDLGAAYEKIVNFLGTYPDDENALFNIQPIGIFNGYDRINFSTTFTLNPRLYENCSKSQK